MNNNTFIVSPSKFGVRREYLIPSLLLEQKKSLIVFDNNVNNSYEYTNKQKQEQGYLVFKYDLFDKELYIKLQQLLTDKNTQKYIFYIQQGAFTLNQEFRTKNGNEKMGELFRMILEESTNSGIHIFIKDFLRHDPENKELLKILNTGRNKKISVTIMEYSYKECIEVVKNCFSKIFVFGIMDIGDAEYFSKASNNLVTPLEMMYMPDNKALVLLSNKPPKIVEKAMAYKMERV
ncbi:MULTISPECIES: type IV secretory system conjugative DNA transfer family protein [Bacillus cereus group]|nr:MULTISPECIES: type IV secretory system conjugative DNA transfer family protein [Bacillus cereus group]MCQ6336592.1 type IV secretory system conjugative DNA transfer family protein [Bacillus cereus]MDF9490529.1 type IV secretory system conjugative DNA transfer family protein [Bacillus cereus]MDF9512578.1 type IV secretory system conjugative DNA transfer family protein [Bacillus paranthracis]MDG1621953.1 type IV secretory system conjugative DNA transfer family protein [Bacillus mobilis]HEF523